MRIVFQNVPNTRLPVYQEMTWYWVRDPLKINGAGDPSWRRPIVDKGYMDDPFPAGTVSWEASVAHQDIRQPGSSESLMATARS